MNNHPIGFLDSGVGGLTVVKEVMKIMPEETIYYIGDSARNPYGPRSQEEVLMFTRQLANFLVSKGIKLLVIACNTATVAALDILKKELDIPVIGVIESGSRAAVEQSRNKKIGIIATQGTVRSNEYEKQIAHLLGGAELQSVACPRFVSIVEKDRYEDERAKQIVAEELTPFKGSEMDTLVLGCTHYPLLQDIIQDYFGRGLTLIDPGVETAKYLKSDLLERNLKNKTDETKKDHVFYTTGAAETFTAIAKNWLQLEQFCVKHIPIKEIETYAK